LIRTLSIDQKIKQQTNLFLSYEIVD